MRGAEEEDVRSMIGLGEECAGEGGVDGRGSSSRGRDRFRRRHWEGWASNLSAESCEFRGLRAG
jgi:hypothetical protein